MGTIKITANGATSSRTGRRDEEREQYAQRGDEHRSVAREDLAGR